MSFRTPLTAAGVAVAIALLVACVWCGRNRPPRPESAIEATTAVLVVLHDSNGMPVKRISIRDAARVHELLAALGIDKHLAAPCPADYGSAELGLHLSGRDAYARRDVYVWALHGDPSIVTVTSAGCTRGSPLDAPSLRDALSRGGLRE